MRSFGPLPNPPSFPAIVQDLGNNRFSSGSNSKFPGEAVQREMTTDMNDGQQQFCLRWHNYQNSLLSSLPRLLDWDDLTDVTLYAGGSSIKAHRIVLSACSHYFKSIFKGKYDDNYGQHAEGWFSNKRARQEDSPSVSNSEIHHQILPLTNNGSNIAGPCSTKNIYLRKSRTPRRSSPSIPVQQNIVPEDLSKKSEDLSQSPPIATASYSHQAKEESAPAKSTSKLYATCQICNKNLSNQYNLRVHMETHLNAHYACSSCSHVSRSRDALRKHVSYRHPPVSQILNQTGPSEECTSEPPQLHQIQQQSNKGLSPF